MKTTIATIATIAIIASGGLSAAQAAKITDCQVQASADLRKEEGVTPVTLQLPESGSGTLDFHFAFGPKHARLGGDTAKIAVCKVGEKDGRPVFTLVYRVKVTAGRATVRFALPDKGSSDVSVVVSGDTYFGKVVVGEDTVHFGEKTPEVSWTPDKK